MNSDKLSSFNSSNLFSSFFSGLYLAHISFKSSKWILLLIILGFNTVKIFLNWMRELLSRKSYWSMALCLYLFKANLFPDLIPIAFDKRDNLVSNFSLTSFSSFFWLEFVFESSSVWPASSSWCKNSLKPLVAHSQSILESFEYFEI